MLVTDGGQVIRCAVNEISITGRRTQGVWIFRVDEGEKVVSVSLAGDENGNDAEEGEESEADGSGGGDASES
jgi:DNA gyrase subunit A